MFAANPGKYRPVLDFSLSGDRKIFAKGSEGLTTKFGLKDDDVHAFVDQVDNRVTTDGYSNLLMIHGEEYNAGDVIPDDAFKHLLKEPNLCTLAEVRHNAQIVWEAEDRMTQDDSMFHSFLYNSLTKEAIDRVSLRKDDYTLDINGQKVLSGTCLLKTILSLSRVDNQARARMLRSKLQKLTMVMQECDNDIVKFNERVEMMEHELNSYGQSTDGHLISSLFEAYLSVRESRFTSYIQYKQDTYDDDGLLTEKELMAFAKNKYETMVSSDEWNKDDKVIALQAKTTARKPSEAKPTVTKAKGKTPAKKTKGNKKAIDYKWKKVAPKPNEPRTKTVNEKVYHWCNKHQAWTLHTPAECKGVDFKPRVQGTGDSGNNPPKQHNEGTTNWQIQPSAHMCTFVDDTYSMDESDEETME